MQIEMIDGNGNYYTFNSSNKDFAPTGPHKIDFPIGEDNFLLTIDNGTNSLGFSLSSLRTQTLYYAGNFIRDYGTSNDFINEFIIFLRHLLRTLNKIKFAFVESPYLRESAKNNSYATLRNSFNTIKQTILETGNCHFFAENPSSWMSSFLEPSDKVYKENKRNIMNKVRGLYNLPFYKFKKGDVYDAIGIKENFFKHNTAPNCYLRTTTTTLPPTPRNKTTYMNWAFMSPETTKDAIYKNMFLDKEPYTNNGVTLFSYNPDFEFFENLYTFNYYSPTTISVCFVEVTYDILHIFYDNLDPKITIQPGDIWLLATHKSLTENPNVSSVII